MLETPKDATLLLSFVDKMDGFAVVSNKARSVLRSLLVACHQ